MKTNASGVDLIKRWEGFRLNAYLDTGKVPTIGIGHTSMAGPPEVKMGMKISEEEAIHILIADLAKTETYVLDVLNRIPTSNQFSAFVSLCFNIGPKAFAGSTAVRKFNTGDTHGAADAILKWDMDNGVHLAGLLARRRAERELFLTPDPPKKGTP